MKTRLLAACAMSLCLAVPAMAHATEIGVSMALFDDNFLTVLRNGMQDYAKTLPDVTLQVEDAQNDVGKQLNQIQNFVAQGVQAIIVNPVDTDATPAMTKLATAAGIPLVYVNRLPGDPTLPEKVSFVGSDEQQSGTLEMQEVCRLLGGKGTILVMMGELSNQAARQRTQDVHDVHRHARVLRHHHRAGADRQLVAHPGHRPDDQLDQRRPAVRRPRLQQ